MNATIQTPEICVSDSLRKFAQEHTPALLFGKLETEKKAFKYSHIQNVMQIGMEFDLTGLNRELMQICLQLHDIGRRKQFDIMGNFDDNMLDHHVLAVQMISEWFKINYDSQATELSADWQIVVDCCLYHGNTALSSLAHEWSVPYLNIVRTADQIENGCIGALQYLEYEKKCDIKGYIAADPMRDQSDCNPALFQYLADGQVFSKAALCHTYAEYFIYAATLAIHTYLKYPEITTKYMNKHHTIERYIGIFQRNLKPDDAKMATQIMHQKQKSLQI